MIIDIYSTDKSNTITWIRKKQYNNDERNPTTTFTFVSLDFFRILKFHAVTTYIQQLVHIKTAPGCWGNSIQKVFHG